MLDACHRLRSLQAFDHGGSERPVASRRNASGVDIVLREQQLIISRCTVLRMHRADNRCDEIARFEQFALFTLPLLLRIFDSGVHRLLVFGLFLLALFVTSALVFGFLLALLFLFLFVTCTAIFSFTLFAFIFSLVITSTLVTRAAITCALVFGFLLALLFLFLFVTCALVFGFAFLLLLLSLFLFVLFVLAGLVQHLQDAVHAFEIFVVGKFAIRRNLDPRQEHWPIFDPVLSGDAFEDLRIVDLGIICELG